MRDQYLQNVRELSMVQEQTEKLPRGCVFPHKKGKYVAFEHEYYVNGKRMRKTVPKMKVEEFKKKIEKRRRLEEYKKLLEQTVQEMEAKLRAEGVEPEQMQQDFRQNEEYVRQMYFESERNIASDHYHNNVYTTFEGVNVRSKAEVIIANALTLNSMFFYYERPICINGIWYKPDFTIILDGEIIIWEHVGLLENESYRENWETKRRNYAKAGFIEGKNLIVTYEHTGFDAIEVQYQIDQLKRKWKWRSAPAT